jgi:isopentenyl diphosphate isomerase/L-lactate dehydrogenase-like FMN-dependent dehydrogenase
MVQRRPGTDRTSTDRRFNGVRSVEDVEALARRRLPPSLYRSVAHGASEGRTKEWNALSFDEVQFLPRAATYHQQRDVGTTVLGQKIALPVLAAPTGATRLLHPGGAIAVANACADAGTLTVVSQDCGHTVEDVAAAVNSTGRLWQQLYLNRGRSDAEDLIDRARIAGYGALVLTVDLAVDPDLRYSWRKKTIASRPIKADVYNALHFAPELLRRPRWLYRFLRDDLDIGELVAAMASRPGQPKIATWEDVAWIRERWSGPIVFKGIVTAQDAKRAAEAGAGAIVVSNHGGKALDGTIPTLRALVDIVGEVDPSVDVLLDGGVRSGSDVVKAVALGARAVLIGRPYLWALAAAGESGVSKLLEMYRREIDRTLGLIGCGAIAELDSSYVRTPPGWVADSSPNKIRANGPQGTGVAGISEVARVRSR